MRMNEDPLTAWLMIDQNSSILCGHCTCIAGCSEICSHVAALTFTICFDKNWAVSCTGRLAEWNVPKTKSLVQPKKIKDIDFGPPIKTKAYSSELP